MDEPRTKSEHDGRALISAELQEALARKREIERELVRINLRLQHLEQATAGFKHTS